MWLRRVFRLSAILVTAFVLTSALMFWLQVIRSPDSFDFYPYTGGDWSSHGFGDYYPATEALKTLSPIQERQLLEVISDELKRKPSDELYKMKAFEDVCLNELVDCRGLASTKIKPFIETILSDRQTSETALLACARFRRHRVRCFDGTGGASWSVVSSRESSSLRLCG